MPWRLRGGGGGSDDKGNEEAAEILLQQTGGEPSSPSASNSMGSEQNGGGDSISSSEARKRFRALTSEREEEPSRSDDEDGGGEKDEFVELIAERLTSLSMEERERAAYDIHCVSDLADEPPDKVSKMLSQMRSQLSTAVQETSPEIRSALSIAQGDGSVDDSYLLKFIRAANYDVPEAAKRMIRHLEHRKWLFGTEKLFTTITLQDMGNEEMELLKIGWLGPSALRDRSERLVLYFYPFRIRNKGFSAEARVRM